ncbi:hypothetical protein [Nocardioides sp. Soil805]|uniref:hypothetical protein n=1 Tax=Nocardioides sp. Soil805 TaxID=1736416 RepID=UPI00070273F8|nr:hypothetical protein [Nocardioides sp. Soil805]KRF34124.1 hypothetical protein ASG94_15405 [Nocardioides sp. Soil805]
MDDGTAHEKPPQHDLTGRMLGATRRLAAAGMAAPVVATRPLRHALAMAVRSLDELPSVGEQLDVLMAEVHAQRLGLQSVQAQLAALDTQLALLERSLAPVSAWTHQSQNLRRSLVRAIDVLPPDPRDPG